METDKIPQEKPTAQVPLENEPVNNPISNQKGFVPIIIGVIVLLLVVGVGAYCLGTQNPKMGGTPENNSYMTQTPTPDTSIQPSQPPDYVNTLGLTTFSYLESSIDTYIKATIYIYNPVVEYPNSKQRTINRTFTQQVDQTYEPNEVKGSVPTGSWIELIKEPIDNPTNAGSILVSDGLFSFKKVPNTSNFIFSIELMRSAGEAGGGSWAPTKFERVLYFYDKNSTSEKLKRVQVFDKDNFKYSFPKIDTFSSDGRYVSIKLFGCWGCGGHVPETYLLDTKTLKTKNIGQVSFFEWKNNGGYGYKDYVVIECAEPTPGECSQDPNTLPLKTGSI